MHRPRRQEDVAQRPQTDAGVGQMMEHARADDLIEFASNFPHALDRELVELEILDIVFLLQSTGEVQARLADVDTRHPRLGLAQRIGGGLGGTATRDKDIAIGPLRTGRPKQVEQGPAPLRVSVELAVPLQVGDRRRIGMCVVEFTHSLVRRHRSGRAHLLQPASCPRHPPQIGRAADLREAPSINPSYPIEPTRPQ